MRDDVIQTCQVRPPQGPFEGGCNVTRCESPTVAVLEVGGGHATRRADGTVGANMNTTILRLCREHARQARRELTPYVGGRK